MRYEEQQKVYDLVLKYAEGKVPVRAVVRAVKGSRTVPTGKWDKLDPGAGMDPWPVVAAALDETTISEEAEQRLWDALAGA